MSEELKKFTESKRGPGSLWYIASPYSHPDPKVVEARVQELKECVTSMIENYSSAVPFSPVLYTLSLQESGLVGSPPEGWYAFDLAFLRKADRLIVLELEGWESSIGVALEIAFAQSRGLQIDYYTKAQLLAEDIPF